MIALNFLRFPASDVVRAGVWVNAAEIADALRHGADPVSLADELEKLDDAPAQEHLFMAPPPEVRSQPIPDFVYGSHFDGLHPDLGDRCTLIVGCPATIHIEGCPEDR